MDFYQFIFFDLLTIKGKKCMDFYQFIFFNLLTIKGKKCMDFYGSAKGDRFLPLPLFHGLRRLGPRMTYYAVGRHRTSLNARQTSLP
jgi:hypothetical protein